MCEERMECITAKSMTTSMAQTQGKLAKSSPQVRLREMAVFFWSRCECWQSV